MSVMEDPLERVGAKWGWLFNLAWIGIMVGLFGPLQIMLPNQAAVLDPENKEVLLSTVLTAGALFSLIANPLWGALSDRTRSRYGRRLPWIAAGALGGVIGLLILASASTPLVMVAGWCFVQTALNASWAALTATVPDQVPVTQRGSIAGWLGLAQTIGVFVATGLAALLPGPIGYTACAVVMIAVMVPFFLLRRPAAQRVSARPAWRWREFASSFWISPRRHPDFAWGWLARFLMYLGNTMGLIYMLFFLRDELGRTHAEVDLLLLSIINAAGTASAVVVAGVWSDRVGRRKPFVIAAGLIMAAAALTVAIHPTWTTMMLASFVLGVGFGTFTSVDFALLTQVLPKTGTAGKDMGVLNIAASLPQVIAPLIAALIVTQMGSYLPLFVASAVCAVAGAALVNRIRSVR